MKYTDITSQQKVNGEMAARSLTNLAFITYSFSDYEVAEVEEDGCKRYIVYECNEIVTECDTFEELADFFEEV